MYRNTSSIESWIYNDIDCQFAICEKMFLECDRFQIRRTTQHK